MNHSHHEPGSFDIWFKNSEMWQSHAHCVLYDPVIIFLDFWGNIMVGLAYLIIPALLARLIVGMWRQLKAFRKLILHGAVFVLLCGSTHFIHAWNWSGTAYAEQAILELLTGVISMLFVSHLFLFIRRRAWEK
jgi:chemotaxis family two-component system sensor kinase Cph1